MKTHYSLLLIFFLIAQFAFGRIRNGYEQQVNSVHESLKCLTDLLVDTSMPPSKKKTIKLRIESLVNYLACYQLTKHLLMEFKDISPDIYYQTDSIKDARERPTDVYVKFILREDADIMAAGTTYMAQTEGEQDKCISEYGEQTVLVKVWAFSQSLFVLSHEFGHVNYQISNLANYAKYYRSTYGKSISESNSLGHEPDDESGKHADHFERKFKHDYVQYLKSRKDDKLLSSPIAFVQDIRKKIYSEMTNTWLASL